MVLRRRRGREKSLKSEEPASRGRRPPGDLEPLHLAFPSLGVDPRDEDDALSLTAPLTSIWFESSTAALRVPTVALDAEVLCADGRTFLGRIFVPPSASHHEGATRPEEWMNEGTNFFPFLPDKATVPIILNKPEILILSVPAVADAGDVEEGVTVLERRVAVVVGGRRILGTIVLDMPQNHCRVLDYLNRGDRFLTLRDGDRHHLVQKARITRVEEPREV
jgi:hypothetical protein